MSGIQRRKSWYQKAEAGIKVGTAFWISTFGNQFLMKRDKFFKLYMYIRSVV